MNIYRPAKFPKIRLEALGTNAIVGYAITGRLAGDQKALVAGDRETVMRSARNYFGPHFQEAGMQDVVLLTPAAFVELCMLANVDLTEPA